MAKKLDLNCMLEEIHAWKKLLKRKNEEIGKFQTKMTVLQKQNEVLGETKNTLLSEVSHFNSMLSGLNDSITKLEESEGEKKALVFENENLKKSFEEQDKLHKLEIKQLKEEIEKITQTHKKELENQTLQAKQNAACWMESYTQKIREKENQILKLEQDISNINNEKHQEALKIRIEYEEKLNKLKTHLLKNKATHPFQKDFKTGDIFRHKFLQLEKESKEESLLYQRELEKLQTQINILKSTSMFPNSTSFPNISHEKVPLNHADKIIKKPNQTLNSNKRRANYDSSLTSLPGDKNENTKEIVRPVKKKLFNIDMNYFVK